MDLPVIGGVQLRQRALGFPCWPAGLVWLVKHEAAKCFLLYLCAPEWGAVDPTCHPYSAGKSGSATPALDVASCWGPLPWLHGDRAG